jgi:sugar/nucleoside kinase (ribokinase family)
MKVVGIGNALVDVMTIIENDDLLKQLGFPKGSMQLVDNELSNRIKTETKQFVESLKSGGSAANTIHGLGMLGVEVGFIGSVGKDKIGDIFESDMKSAGVRSYLMRRDQDSGTAVAMITPDSERTFATHLGAAVEMESSDLFIGLFQGYDFLYLEGYLITNIELVKKACKLAKEAGLKIGIDLSSFNVVEAFREQFIEIVNDYVDVIFANEEEAKSFTGLEPEAALDKMAEKCEIVIVKVGKEGSLIKRGEETVRVGTIEVKSLDTTGAGDLYAAGFLYGLTKNMSLEICGTIGSLLAGNVIEVVGPKMDQQRWEKIREEIKRLEEIHAI